MPNIETLLTTIVQPLIKFPDQLEIQIEETDDFIEYHLHLNPEDIGRVIGRKGRVIRSIRTIIYSIRNASDKRTKIIVNDDKE
ncbi:KH domain-containing protein [Aerococcaceae bacterium DSM 111020]|nr:KH domain-containing protein [Aerococcaceae bacterium DSM 111020]